jgi:hypothetical protein
MCANFCCTSWLRDFHCVSIIPLRPFLYHTGVGGWSESGVDPGIFSQALMYYAQQATNKFRKEVLASQEDLEAGAPIFPHDLLSAAYDSVMQDAEIQAGELLSSYQE